MKQNVYDDEEFFKYYKTLRESGVTYNDFIEQPAMKKALQDPTGKTVLDIGCGFGEFTRYCAEQGAARVIGIDISEKMIAEAKQANSHPNVEFRCVAMEDLDVEGEKFDMIVSTLAFHYIGDYEGLVRKVSSLLNEKGQFLFSAEHPAVTARKEMDNWVTNESGDKLHWAFDNYQSEGKRSQHWVIDGVVKYHRTVSTLVNTLLTNGLALEELIEPLPTQEGLKRMPKLTNEYRRPSFILLSARKS